jgi:hypothetical protein
MHNMEKEMKLPKVIGKRTRVLAPILRKWKKLNPKADWGDFLQLGISESQSIRKIAGKRYGHLLTVEAA